MNFMDKYNLITEIFNFYIILEKIKQWGLIRAKVPKTKENLQKCICMKCSSYTFTCKMKSIPGNISRWRWGYV
jgi:hypothetical protein